jgi:predicted RNase H-like HicB family nuclease
MDKRMLHAVVYKDSQTEDWVAHCVEYDITSSGDSPEHALEMIQEAVELHFEGATPEIIDQIDNEVGSEPLIKAFAVRAPALLDR